METEREGREGARKEGSREGAGYKPLSEGQPHLPDCGGLGICLGCKMQVSDLASFVDVIDFMCIFGVNFWFSFLATSRKFGFTLNRSFQFWCI